MSRTPILFPRRNELFKTGRRRNCATVRVASEAGGIHGNVWQNRCLDVALHHIEEGSSPLPSIRDFTCILQKCRKLKSRPHALRLHAYMRNNGLEAHSTLGNYLVPLLTEIGSIADARQVFDKLPSRNEWSWSSLICGYARCGESGQALALYREMCREHSLQPMGQTYVNLIKSCVKLKDIERGLEIHSDVARNGILERDGFIGSCLVEMYAKCGSISKAQEVFDTLLVQDLFTWTSLIAGYVDHGHGVEALRYYEQMQLYGVPPDAATIVCALKACTSLRSAQRGQEIHMEIKRLGWMERSLPVGNALVDMYAKSGCLSMAHQVLREIPDPDVITWTAVMCGYSEHGFDMEAIECFEQMQCEGIRPNSVTFICALKCSGSMADVEQGHTIHIEIEKLGLLEKDLTIGNALVDMYAKCGLPATAHQIFDGLLVRNVVTWDALIQGYVETGSAKEALQCFEQMQLEGICPDAFSFVNALRSCSILGAIEKGEEFYVRIEKQGYLDVDIIVGNTLVDMYVKCGLLAEAQCVFEKLKSPDVVSWTVLIAGYTEHGSGEEALKCFEWMQSNNVYPNLVTITCALKACGCIMDVVTGQEIHAYIERHGLLEANTTVADAVVDMYVKCGVVAFAQKVFNRLPVRSLTSWAALISGYAANECGEEAIKYFEKMCLEGIRPDAITYACVLNACASVGAIEKGREIHSEIERQGLMETGNTLVSMYAKCGLVSKAQEVFDTLLVQDVVSWTALMVGYAQVGEIEKVCCLFETMLGEDIKPDPVTFLVVLNACCQAGFFESSRTYFEVMKEDYGIIPSSQHYVCMVDSFARVGRVDEAIEMIKKCCLCLNSAAWNALLSACKNWGNLDSTRKVFEHALSSGAKNAVTYDLMSHVCAGAEVRVVG